MDFSISCESKKQAAPKLGALIKGFCHIVPPGTGPRWYLWGGEGACLSYMGEMSLLSCFACMFWNIWLRGCWSINIHTYICIFLCVGCITPCRLTWLWSVTSVAWLSSVWIAYCLVKCLPEHLEIASWLVWWFPVLIWSELLAPCWLSRLR